MPDLGLHGWTTGDDVDILTDIRVASAAGFQAVELRDGKIEPYLAQGGSLSALRDAVAQAGLRVLSVNTLDDSTLPVGDELEARAARCRLLSAWAEALGSPHVIVGPSYLPASGLGRDAVTARSVAALRRYADIAADHGVRIGFEFLGYAACSVNSLGDSLALLDAAGDPRIGLVIDSYHFFVGGSRLEDVARLDRDRLLILHLADAEHGDRARLRRPDRVFPGDGVIPLKEWVGAFRKIGYDGPYSLELLRPEYWAMDPMIVARRGRESLARVV